MCIRDSPTMQMLISNTEVADMLYRGFQGTQFKDAQGILGCQIRPIYTFDVTNPKSRTQRRETTQTPLNVVAEISRTNLRKGAEMKEANKRLMPEFADNGEATQCLRAQLGHRRRASRTQYHHGDHGGMRPRPPPLTTTQPSTECHTSSTTRRTHSDKAGFFSRRLRRLECR